MQGLILKGVGGFYTVRTQTGEEFVCKARGRFRRDGITPVPGDRVEFAVTQESARIDAILPRKNLLVRPAVANVDKLMIVMALSAPRPDLLLTDKLLLQCALLNITPVLVLNKCDEKDDALFAQILREYNPAGYAILCTSSRINDGRDAMIAQLQGCVSCFAGQSAVGKSSLLNMLLALGLTTGELSAKTERGKHTTRHAELWPAYGGAIVDTPGFSLLDVTDMEPEALSGLYPEMQGAEPCRFAQCLHVREPGCAVKARLATGAFAPGRYERYQIILEELKEMRKHRYD